MKVKCFFVPTFLLALLSVAALASDELPSSTIEKSLVILRSSGNYSAAAKTAKEASQSLGIKLNLRGLSPNKKTGLTFSKESCMSGPIQEFPCYQARGKNDDGEYLSVEFSSEYKEMRPGLFIVVAYSGDKTGAQDTLKKSKSKFKDAYIKTVKRYMAGE